MGKAGHKSQQVALARLTPRRFRGMQAKYRGMGRMELANQIIGLMMVAVPLIAGAAAIVARSRGAGWCATWRCSPLPGDPDGLSAGDRLAVFDSRA